MYGTFIHRHKDAGPIMAQMQKTWRKLKRERIVGIRSQCCGTCSACEGGNKMDEDDSLLGYAFYHVQDREGLNEGGYLYVGYGAASGKTEDAAPIGQILRLVFEKDGFVVEWDGSGRTRLKLTLPEAVTAEIFSSMKAVQQAKAQRYHQEGQAKATDIIATARAQEQRILAAAQTKVAEIDAESHRVVGEYYKRFQEYPELQIFLDKLKSAVNALRTRSTIILDTSGPPFDLFGMDLSQPLTLPSVVALPAPKMSESVKGAIAPGADDE